jgi:hypothetical protein
MTTTQQLDQARAELDEARTELKEAARRGVSGSNWIVVQEQHHRAKIRVDGLEERVRELGAQLAAAQAAQAERDRVEQQNGPQLRAAGDELAESHRALVAAVEAAEQALIELHRRAAAHAGLVEQHRAELSALGLGTGVRTDGSEHAHAAELRGVRIDGQFWWAPDPGAVVAHAAQLAVAGTLGAHHPLRVRLRALEGADGGKLDQLLRAPEKPRVRRSRAS